MNHYMQYFHKSMFAALIILTNTIYANAQSSPLRLVENINICTIGKAIIGTSIFIEEECKKMDRQKTFLLSTSETGADSVEIDIDDYNNRNDSINAMIELSKNHNRTKFCISVYYNNNEKNKRDEELRKILDDINKMIGKVKNINVVDGGYFGGSSNNRKYIILSSGRCE